MTISTGSPSPTQIAPPEDKSGAKSELSFASKFVARVGAQNLSLIVALIVLAAAIGSQNANFFSLPNMQVIGEGVAILGVLAVGQTVIMLLGGLDISVGSQAGLASVVSAMVFTSSGSAIFGMAVAIVVGAVAGLVNALIIVYGRVNAVIATLATFAAYRGVVNLVSNGSAQGYTGGDDVFTFLSLGKVAGIPVLILVFLVIAALVYTMLTFTDIGRNIYAIGGNKVAARLSGLRINKYVIGAYMLMGVIAAIAGILLTARTGSGQPTSGSQGLELQVITAVALGGCALQGGKGSIIGTVLAVILLGVLTNGLQILGVNSFWQDIAQGTMLVIAVVIQQRRRGTRAVGLPD
ncbi:ABC transporter permease [Demequina aurantiaca]|uniref:ABC transporter permease n=1 Tax=Demequina aurantiaca TaxID=676200 RepID=UPI000A05CA50|nr:ABC transporter permease [Demequina aurantiaca]